MIYLLAYTGMRISETLALRNDDRFVRDQLGGCWRIHVRQQVHKSRRKTLLPKWRKKRWAFVPTFLSDELTDLLDATPDGALLFPSPGRKVRLDDGTITRVGCGPAPLRPLARTRLDTDRRAHPGLARTRRLVAT